MDVARFLDNPIRLNPRRAFENLALPPSTSPGSLSPVQSSLNLEPNDEFSWETDFLSTEAVASVPSTAPSCVTFWRNEPEPLQNLSPDQTTPGEVDQEQSPERHGSAKKRKRITKAACTACRKRKAKCDGKRPACVSCTTKKRSCEYLAEEGVSSQAVTKRRLDGYATVLQLLRDADPEDCELILQDLKRPRNLSEAVDTVQKTWMSMDTPKKQMIP